jgi:SAM-dependent methyltransferase
MSTNEFICPVCTSSDTQRFLLRPSVVVHQNLLVDQPDRARELKRGDLRLHCCRSCGFVFNTAFDLRRIDYGGSYDNCQTFSPLFAEYTEQLVNELIQEKGVRGCRIVEIGCGEGAFLRRLVEAADANNTGWGFDPSYVGPEVRCDGRLRFARRYYDEECADIPADVVVCRHVIEHVPDPVGLLRTVNRALAGSPCPRLFFETPCVDWILTHQVIWDFFYEHCSYFTANSLRTAFERAGFSVVEVRHVFGGQYLCLEAVKAPGEAATTCQPGETAQRATRFAEVERRRIAAWTHRVERLAGRGKVAIWGAGAKGVTFANLVDPQQHLIDCVVDVNPRKSGRFLPGTGHPIVSPPMVNSRDVSTALVLNPNYLGEIVALMTRQKPGARVLDLMEMQEALS